MIVKHVHRRLSNWGLCLALMALLVVLVRPVAPAAAQPAGVGDTVIALLSADLCSAAGGQPAHGDVDGPPSHCVLCFAPATSLLAAAAAVVPSPSANGALLRSQPLQAQPALPAPAAYDSRAPPVA